jgi:glucose/arabinose dehydrogenase
MIKQFALIAVIVALVACQNGGPISPPPAPPSPPTPPSPPSPPSPPPSGTLKLGVNQVGSGFDQPLYVTYAPGANDLYVVEKTGKVEILEGNAPRSTPFLNISDKISTNIEQGLLSIAFHPNYTSNSYVYAFYSKKSSSSPNGDSVISRFTANRTTKTVDLTTEKPLLTISRDPKEGNHNGGQLQFGPDGYLYISVGDGGSQEDPNGNGQNKNVLNAKMLRIEVKDDGTYSIPTGNPYKAGGGLPEIWAYGFRNPWRFSFDKSTGDMWIGDVGGSQTKEEVNFQARNATDAAGRNYGWHIYEGSVCIKGGCNPSGMTFPIFTYDHSGGDCSITGGYVYRGTEYATMQGRYFMGDFCSGSIRSIVSNGSGGWTSKLELPNAVASLSGFGEGPDGSIYATSLGDPSKGIPGKIFKLIAKP